MVSPRREVSRPQAVRCRGGRSGGFSGVGTGKHDHLRSAGGCSSRWAICALAWARGNLLFLALDPEPTGRLTLKSCASQPPGSGLTASRLGAAAAVAVPSTR